MAERYAIRKMAEKGRDGQGRAIYPAGAWTVWLGQRYVGWNWDCLRLLRAVHSYSS